MPAITRELDVLARCGNQFRNERLKSLSLTAFQAPYLLRICAHPGLSQEELARALHVNASSAARHLASLEEGGYITRETKADDKRQLAVFPTGKARDALPLVRGVNAQWHAWLTADMTAEESAALETLLEKMRRRAEAWDFGKEEAP